jgi:hypothetical protein
LELFQSRQWQRVHSLHHGQELGDDSKAEPVVNVTNKHVKKFLKIKRFVNTSFYNKKLL